MPTPTLVLASTSRYRADLLNRLGVPFVQAGSEVDEAHRANEAPKDRSIRLAIEKAEALADRYQGSVLLGSDQVGSCGQRLLDKPGDATTAVAVLKSLRGQTLCFYTSICVHNTVTGDNAVHTDVTELKLRADLSDADIERYVEIDNPIDCAGSFKAETEHGKALFTSIATEDPTGIVGLPLIATAALLRASGYPVP